MSLTAKLARLRHLAALGDIEAADALRVHARRWRAPSEYAFALAAGTPSRAAWTTLCALIDDGVVQSDDPRLLEALGRWSGALRPAPRRWLERWIEQGDAPLWLVGAVEFGEPFARLTDGWQRLSRMLEEITERGGRIERLELHNRGLTASRAQALCEGSFWRSLRALDLSAIGLDHRALSVVLESAPLDTLTALELADNRLRVEGWCALAAAIADGRLPALEHLGLANASASPPGIHAMASAGNATSLRSLDLRDNGLSSEAMRELLNAAWARTLSKLVLQRNKIDIRLARALAQSGVAGRLGHLDARHCRLDEATLEALIEGLSPEQLRVLELGENRFARDALAKTLATRGPWSVLTRLDLSGCGLRREDIVDLLVPGAWPALEALDLGENLIATDGLRSLLSGLSRGQLRALSLRRWRLGEQALEGLPMSPTLERLEVLDLSYCDLFDEGAKRLAAALGLSALRILKLRSCQIGRAGVAALEAVASARPKMTLDLNENPGRAVGSSD